MTDPAKTVCVTGASGYIASHVVVTLLKRGYHVRGTVRNQQKASFLHKIAKEYPDETNGSRLLLFDADLLKEGSFDEPVQGCSFVIHVASPVGYKVKDPENDMIKPAINGALNVLNACKKAKTVRKVVMTSSVAAVQDLATPMSHVFTEEDWPKNLTKEDPYPYAKTMAEKAAWDFVERLNADEKFELITICPAWVLGPTLSGTVDEVGSDGALVSVCQSKWPLLPRIGWNCVDVRDVALAHVLAMERSNAKGRYIIANTHLWMKDMALLVNKSHPEIAANTWEAPSAVVYAFTLVEKRIDKKWLELNLNRQKLYSHDKVCKDLGLELTPLDVTIKDACESFLAHKIVEPKPPLAGLKFFMAGAVTAAAIGAYYWIKQQK